jgi:hypothetical protein
MPAFPRLHTRDMLRFVFLPKEAEAIVRTAHFFLPFYSFFIQNLSFREKRIVLPQN